MKTRCETKDAESDTGVVAACRSVVGINESQVGKLEKRHPPPSQHPIAEEICAATFLAVLVFELSFHIRRRHAEVSLPHACTTSWCKRQARSRFNNPYRYEKTRRLFTTTELTVANGAATQTSKVIGKGRGVTCGVWGNRVSKFQTDRRPISRPSCVFIPSLPGAYCCKEKNFVSITRCLVPLHPLLYPPQNAILATYLERRIAGTFRQGQNGSSYINKRNT